MNFIVPPTSSNHNYINEVLPYISSNSPLFVDYIKKYIASIYGLNQEKYDVLRIMIQHLTPELRDQITYFPRGWDDALERAKANEPYLD